MRTGLLIAIIAVLALLLLAALAVLAVVLTQGDPSRGALRYASLDVAAQSNLGYLLAGTLLTWAGFFAYAVYLWRKNRDLHREVEELRHTLGEPE